MTALSICKGCVCVCARVCVCAAASSQPPVDRTKAAMLFVLSVSFFLLAHTVPDLWLVHCEASACLSDTHTHTHTCMLLGSLEAKAPTESLHAWPWEASILGVSALFSVSAFLWCLSASAGSQSFWQTNDTWWKGPTAPCCLCYLTLGKLS